MMIYLPSEIMSSSSLVVIVIVDVGVTVDFSICFENNKNTTIYNFLLVGKCVFARHVASVSRLRAMRMRKTQLQDPRSDRTVWVVVVI